MPALETTDNNIDYQLFIYSLYRMFMETPSERLKRKIMIENLWLFILSLLKERPLYGSEIRKAVKTRFGFWTGNVTSYKVLYSLQKRGYVLRQNKGKRKYYSITEKGRAELRKAREMLKLLVKSI